MKLHQNLRGKRTVALMQLEGVVALTFGQDALQCHLFLELYASGSINLMDRDCRIYRFDESFKTAAKKVYPAQLLGEQEKQLAITTHKQLAGFVHK